MGEKFTNHSLKSVVAAGRTINKDKDVPEGELVEVQHTDDPEKLSLPHILKGSKCSNLLARVNCSAMTPHNLPAAFQLVQAEEGQHCH